MSAKLGQHFLINKSALKKIAESLEVKENDLIIEIGAGHGELTDELKVKNLKLKVIAIEKDEKLFAYLKKKFAFDKNIEIIQGDALKVLPFIIHNSLSITNNLYGEAKLQYTKTPFYYKIVGNIPYYITGRILRIIGEAENKPEITVLTIQKEVALRLSANPPKMNLLAASVQFWSKPKIVSFIKKTSFSPQPKIDSAIIKLTKKNEKLKIKDKDYYKLIRIVFKQPRKTILNNLAKGLKKQKNEIEKELKKLDMNPSLRPQNLSIENLVKLAKRFKS